MSRNITYIALEEINLTNIEIEKIKEDVHTNKLDNLKFGDNYNNYLDFYINLYKLRIKLGYSMNKCAKFLGTNYGIIYNRLQTLNWENKNDKINQDDIFNDLKNISLNKEEIKNIKSLIKKYNLKNLRQMSKGYREYTSVLELYKDLYKMRYKLNYTASKMASYIYNDPNKGKSINYRLRPIGWTYSFEESQQLASQTTRNYKEIRLTAKRTALSNYIELEGSSEEKYIRGKFNIELTSRFSELEVIVGFNNLSILDGHEIDIPIIIIDNDRIFKYCIEVNGDRWHNEKSRKKTDNEKKEKALLKKYNLFTIWLGASSKIQREKYGSIDEQIEDIIGNIENKIQKGNAVLNL